jgi:hypothetical protein
MLNIQKTVVTGSAVVAIGAVWNAKSMAQEKSSAGIVAVFDHEKLDASFAKAFSNGGSNLLWSRRESPKAACKPEGCSDKDYTAVVYVLSGTGTLLIGGRPRPRRLKVWRPINPRRRIASYQQRGCVYHASRHYPLV